jgi:hypothetical protein
MPGGGQWDIRTKGNFLPGKIKLTEHQDHSFPILFVVLVSSVLPGRMISQN